MRTEGLSWRLSLIHIFELRRCHLGFCGMDVGFRRAQGGPVKMCIRDRLSAYAPKLSDCFFELFLDIHAKGLILKDVVEHKFIGDGSCLLYTSHSILSFLRIQLSYRKQ